MTNIEERIFCSLYVEMDLKGLINLCDKIGVHIEIEGKTAPLTSIKVGNRGKAIVYPSDISSFCQILSYLKENSILGVKTTDYF